MAKKEVHWRTEEVGRVEAAVQEYSGIVGWNLYFKSAGCTWLTSEHCAETPKPGEVVELLGLWFFHPILGVRIGGRVYK